jgi:hypothetical protein
MKWESGCFLMGEISDFPSSGGIMSSVASSPVTIQTSSESVPSVPAWFGEVRLITRHLEQQGALAAVSERVRFARRRFGQYEVIDFFAVVLGYAIRGERTLEAFYKRVQPFARGFMALFSRADLPHRSTLSRFLAALGQVSVEALRTLFVEDLLTRPLASEKPGGLWDRQGVYWLVFDVDGTRSAARQRALPKTADLPAAARRMDKVCASGYTGRKRGEVVRTRTTVLQSHTHEFLGTFSASGNGDYRGELLRAREVIGAYLKAKQIPPSQAIMRLDGLYGNGGVIEDLNGLRYVMRGREYDLLNLQEVQARLKLPPSGQITHPETGICRTLYDCPCLMLKETGVDSRMIVATHPAPERFSPVGTTRDGLVYELFFTNLPQGAFIPGDVVQLYLHRGSFECVLADEDEAQDADRWCSRSSAGQEFWQIISQWAWNLREELGQNLQPSPMRLTEFAPALTTPAPSEIAAQEPAPTYTQPQWARKAQMGGFPGSAFTPQADGTLRCPVGAPLYATERRPERDGSIRVLYSARIGACRACPLRQACQGYGVSTKKPRRVSAVLWPRPDKVAEGTLNLAPPPAPCPILWGDWRRTQNRRAWLDLLRTQTVIVTCFPKQAPPDSSPSTPLTRRHRAHWRLSWSQRLARNAAPLNQAQVLIRLFGIPPTLSRVWGLAVA